MRIITTFSLLLLYLPAFCQTTYIKDSKGGSKAVDLVAGLPEVINADNYVKSVSKGKRHLVSYLASGPTKQYPYYWVKVVEDNGTSYATHFNFYVDTKTYAIKYDDAMVDGKLIPEKKCRKRLMDEYRIK